MKNFLFNMCKPIAYSSLRTGDVRLSYVASAHFAQDGTDIPIT